MRAIFFEDDVPEQWKSYTDKNRDWFQGRETGGFRARTERH